MTGRYTGGCHGATTSASKRGKWALGVSVVVENWYLVRGPVRIYTYISCSYNRGGASEARRRACFGEGC